MCICSCLIACRQRIPALRPLSSAIDRGSASFSGTARHAVSCTRHCQACSGRQMHQHAVLEQCHLLSWQQSHHAESASQTLTQTPPSLTSALRPAIFDILQEMSSVINYSRDMESLAALPEAPPGIPRITIHGGKLEADNKRRELTDLFRFEPRQWLFPSGLVGVQSCASSVHQNVGRRL